MIQTETLDAPLHRVVELEAIIKKFRAMHQDAPSMHCGAQWFAAQPEQHQFSGGKGFGRSLTGFINESMGHELTPFRCTQAVGHDGDHKDGNCCYHPHRIAAEHATPEPYDAWYGQACTCGRHRCSTRAMLDALEV